MIPLLLPLVPNALAIEHQQAANWCWAASIQEALRLTGHYDSQANIVARGKGYILDAPASGAEVVRTLQSYGLTAWEVPVPPTPTEMWTTYGSGFVLLGEMTPSGPYATGHMVVLEGLSANGLVTVADPAYGTTSAMPLSTVYYGYGFRASVVVKVR